MPLTPAHIDDRHQLRGAGIHDAQMRRIELIPDQRFTMVLRGTDGIDRHLILEHLADIGLEHLTNGMIVIYIYAWALDTQAAADARPWPEAWATLLGDRVAPERMDETVARLTEHHQGLKLVYFVTAYGGAIAAICRDIGWEDAPALASGPAQG